MSVLDQVHYRPLLRSHAYINGEWCSAISGKTARVVNPADEQVLGMVPYMQEGDAEAAIKAAEQALPAWRVLPAKERARILRRWYDLIMLHIEDLAVIMTAEQGKPLAESRAEIAYAASFVEWFSEEAKRTYGDIIPAPKAGQRILVQKEPVGVVAAITPWNFPAAMITRKVAPALAAGCSVVVKPALETPYSALALAVLAEEAGLPAGVLNIVTGNAEKIGQAFTSSQVVRKLSFTGSTAVGKKLLAACAPTVKRVSLELGGNAPFIIFDDADIEEAIKGVMASKFRNSGQTCVCANRILVQEGIYDAFVERLAQESRGLRVGSGFMETTKQGPLISEQAIHKAEELIRDAVYQGATIVVGGRRIGEAGYFFEPTVIAGVKQGMAITNQEIFAPVATVIPFADEAEAIAIANNTEAGLASYFYTRDNARIWRVSEALECGIIGVNTGLISNEVAPFGGMKQSGLGREGSHYGIEEYLEVKYVCLG